VAHDLSLTLALLLALTISFSLVADGVAAEEARIVVHPDRELGRVNPLVFGNNQLSYDVDYKRTGKIQTGYTCHGSGVWDPEARRPDPELLGLAREMGITINRFPGGCGTHTFDWKKTIGPVEDRPQWQFGVDEFLQLCAAMETSVVWTVSYFMSTPDDTANMVEYLNAPSDGKNPRGGVDWARKRAENGHPEPYKIRWFEFGNEVYHGNHNDIHRVEPAEYAQRFVQYARAMKAVDPTVQLGAILHNRPTLDVPEERAWATTILPVIKDDVDFLIDHHYPPFDHRRRARDDVEQLFAATLAMPTVLQYKLRQVRGLCEKIVGRALPIAITEYNGGFAGRQFEHPPLRHCLGTALLNADLLRLYSQPGSGVLMANYWQFANSYWGQVKGQHHYEGGGPHIKRPNYFPYEMYHNHFGPRLVEVQVHCQCYDVPAAGSVPPLRGQGGPERVFPDNLLADAHWAVKHVEGVEASVNDGTVTLNFAKPQDINYFHTTSRVSVQPDTMYELTGLVRTENLKTASGVGLAIGDARGWEVTKSQVMSDRVAGTTDWTKVSVRYSTLPETEAVDVIIRRWGERPPRSDAISGKAWVRDVQLYRVTPFALPAAAYLTCNASLSEDGRTLFLMVVNKHLREPITARLETAPFVPAQRAKAWTLNGPAIDSTNEQRSDTVTVTQHDVTLAGGRPSVTFPSHSFTALEIRAR